MVMLFLPAPIGAGTRLDPPEKLSNGDIFELEISGIGILW